MATSQPEYAARPADGQRIAALVLGIASVVFFWVPFIGLLLGIVGAVLAGVSLRQRYTLIGLAALVTSLVGVALGGLTAFGILYAIMNAAG
ncbi:MAG TPA: hypothetical protein PLZ36_12205 [Armatimonadota bacterium]|nr:hypothetical protein [Armatimonadota bacterium]